MNKVIKGAGWLVIIVLALIIVITISGKSGRASEMDNNLDAIVEQTIDNMLNTKSYSVENYKEFVADFIQNLSIYMDTDSDIDVNVLKADEGKGILSVEIVETYKHPNGKTGIVKCEKTVIFNQIPEEAATNYTVKYYLSKEDMNTNSNCFKEYSIAEGDILIKPSAPTMEGKTFVSWKDAADEEVQFSSSVIVQEDQSYYAYFQ